MATSLSTIWGNTDDWDQQYICASSLCLMSVMSQCCSIIIDWGISAPGHGKEVAYGLNAVGKRYKYQSVSTVQIPGPIIFDSHIQMHTGTKKENVSLAKEFQKHLKKKQRKYGVIDQI